MMDDLFFALALLSLLALVIGLIKPSLFTKALKKHATRKGTAKVFGIAFVIFFVLFAVNIESAIPFEEIRRAYEQDKHAAVAEYGGRTLEVKGKLIEVDAGDKLEDVMADPARYERMPMRIYIGETRDESYGHLNCVSTVVENGNVNVEAVTKAMALKQGDIVTVRGTIDKGGLGSIVMHECGVAD